MLANTMRRAVRRLRRWATPPRPVVRLQPAGTPRGTAVVSYLTDCFASPDGPPAHFHTNRWECWVMARTFVEAGYKVEVIDHDNTQYTPPPDCRFVVDLHSNLERMAPALPPDCVRIHHITGPHWLYWNRAELNRLYAVQQRRGTALLPRRQVAPSQGLELASCGTMVGNEFTAGTFSHIPRPIHRIPISTVTTMDWFAGRDFERCRTRFLWVGSFGLVHKGLDLALEAFARMPELELTVCGPVSAEDDFARAFRRELHDLPNIHNLDWVDAHGPAFADLLRTHLAVVYPSCAEGGAGSVISCMHGGVIPIVSYEASIDAGDYGVLLPDVQIDTIVEHVRAFASLPLEQLRQRSHATWEAARRIHTREAFQRNYRRFARDVLHLSVPE